MLEPRDRAHRRRPSAGPGRRPLLRAQEPLIYGRAALNNWQAFADAKIRSVTPRGNSLFWDSTTVSAGAQFGSAYGPTPSEPPSEPAMLTFTVVATDHRATPPAGGLRGRAPEARADFDPARDVDSIMINRWNYGYAHELTSVWDPSLYGPVADQPQVRGRRPFRNVWIANSDSGAFAYTHGAINEAYRAVQDLP